VKWLPNNRLERSGSAGRSAWVLGANGAEERTKRQPDTLRSRETGPIVRVSGEVMFLAGIFLINLRQTPRMVFYQEKIPHKILSGGDWPEKSPTIGI
jgi:hypothetical protein